MRPGNPTINTPFYINGKFDTQFFGNLLRYNIIARAIGRAP